MRTSKFHLVFNRESAVCHRVIQDGEAAFFEIHIPALLVTHCRHTLKHI